jgi:hypothetical protein
MALKKDIVEVTHANILRKIKFLKGKPPSFVMRTI